MAEVSTKDAPERQNDSVKLDDLLRIGGETGKLDDLLKTGRGGGKLDDLLKKDMLPEASGFSRSDTPPLTNEQKEKMKEETGWPDEIIDNIASWEEYEIYKNAGLVATEINGKWCLIRADIDWNQKDEFGRTNKERAEQGLAPLDKNGKSIELHHIGQKQDSPLAELTQEEHRGKGNSGVLHDNSQDSQIDREKFNEERSEHWEARAKEQEENKNG